MEKEIKKEIDKELNKDSVILKELTTLLNECGIKGSTDEIITQLKNTVEFKKKQSKKEELIESSPEYIELKQKYNSLKEEQDKKIFNDDIKEIKCEFDSCTAETIDDLGDLFCIARILGLSNIEAYEFVQKLNERKTEEDIPIIGKVGSSKGTLKDFYSSDELERLSKTDLDNPDILSRAIKSLTKLKK